jgi:hypothetical protein
MRKIAAALGCLAISAAAAPPAGAATTEDFSFEVLHASGTARVEFHADPASGCVAVGRCGAAGTVTTTLVPTKGAEVFLSRFPRAGTAGAVAGIEARTQATVTRPGTNSPCTDRDADDPATLLIEGTRQRVSFQFDLTAELANHCEGPRGDDIAHLPALRRRYAITHFRHRRLRLDLAGTSSFVRSGFAGTVTTDVHITARRIACKSGRCSSAGSGIEFVTTGAGPGGLTVG